MTKLRKSINVMIISVHFLPKKNGVGMLCKEKKYMNKYGMF